MTFEDRLAVQLRDLVATDAAAPTTSRRHPGRLRLVLSGAGVAAVTAFVLLAVDGLGPDAAYAVQTRGDGTVRVVIDDLRDGEGLQHSLRAAGVPAVVDYHPAPLPSCPAAMATPPADVPTGTDDPEGGGALPLASSSTLRVRTEGSGTDRTTTFVVDPADIPPGGQLDIVATGGQIDESTVTVVIDPAGSRLKAVCGS